MKKYLFILAALLCCALLFAGCGCEHEWAAANCTSPMTCTLCQATEGAPLGHTWAAATCTAPKTCELCNVTEGEAKGHTWADATCTAPKTCSSCKLTEGEALGHTWEEATTEAPQTCTTCQATEGSKLVTDPRFTTAATKALHGLWSTNVSLTSEMMGLPEYFETVSCTLFYEFGKTGEMNISFELADPLAFTEDLTQMITELTYETLAAQGIKKEDADVALKAAYGMSMTEYVNTTVATININDMFGMFSAEMVYYADDKGLYYGPSWNSIFEFSEYTLENDVLIIATEVLVEGGEPMQWTRVEEA